MEACFLGGDGFAQNVSGGPRWPCAPASSSSIALDRTQLHRVTVSMLPAPGHPHLSPCSASKPLRNSALPCFALGSLLSWYRKSVRSRDLESWRLTWQGLELLAVLRYWTFLARGVSMGSWLLGATRLCRGYGKDPRMLWEGRAESTVRGHFCPRILLLIPPEEGVLLQFLSHFCHLE